MSRNSRWNCIVSYVIALILLPVASSAFLPRTEWSMCRLGRYWQNLRQSVDNEMHA